MDSSLKFDAEDTEERIDPLTRLARARAGLLEALSRNIGSTCATPRAASSGKGQKHRMHRTARQNALKRDRIIIERRGAYTRSMRTASIRLKLSHIARSTL